MVKSVEGGGGNREVGTKVVELWLHEVKYSWSEQVFIPPTIPNSIVVQPPVTLQQTVPVNIQLHSHSGDVSFRYQMSVRFRTL